VAPAGERVRLNALATTLLILTAACHASSQSAVAPRPVESDAHAGESATTGPIDIDAVLLDRETQHRAPNSPEGSAARLASACPERDPKCVAETCATPIHPPNRWLLVVLPDGPSGMTDHGPVPLGATHEAFVSPEGEALHFGSPPDLNVCGPKLGGPLVGFWQSDASPAQHPGTMFSPESVLWLRENGTYVRGANGVGGITGAWQLEFGSWRSLDAGVITRPTVRLKGEGGQEGFETESMTVYPDAPSCEALPVGSTELLTIDAEPCASQREDCRVFDGAKLHRVAAPRRDFDEAWYRDGCAPGAPAGGFP